VLASRPFHRLKFGCHRLIARELGRASLLMVALAPSVAVALLCAREYSAVEACARRRAKTFGGDVGW